MKFLIYEKNVDKLGLGVEEESGSDESKVVCGLKEYYCKL